MSADLDHSVSYIVRQLLIDLGVASDGVNGEWSVFAGSMPDQPDQLIVVYEMIGVKDGRSMIDGEVFTHPAFSIQVRHPTHPGGIVKAGAIATALDGVLRRTVTAYDLVEPTGTGTGTSSISYLVHAISRFSDPFYIGADPRTNYHLFAFDAKLALEKS